MSHQLSATHLVYRLTGKPSAVPLRKIGTLSATGLMPALLAACGSSSSSSTTDLGTPVTASSGFLITGTGNVVGLFGRQVLGFDPDGDGPSEIAITGAGAVYISKLPPTDLAYSNHHGVDEYDSRSIDGWTFNNVGADTGTPGLAKIAVGDLDGDGFDDIVIGEQSKPTTFRLNFTYDDRGTAALTDDLVTGQELAGGRGRVTVVYGQPQGVLGASSLDFDQNLNDEPDTAFPAEGHTAESYVGIVGNVLLGGRIDRIGNELAIGNVLQGTGFTGAELIISSGGTAFETEPGLRISVINNSALVGIASYLVEENEPIVGATDPNTIAYPNTASAWTIYIGGRLSQENADSPLAIADIGGNTMSDIIVGRYVSSAGTGNPFTGEVHVVYGRAGADVTGVGDVDASTGDPLAPGAEDVVLHTAGWEGTDNVNGFTVSGFPTGTDPKDRAFAGASVAAADINGDGKQDLIIGTPGNTQEFNTGQVYVIYGATSGLTNINVGVDNWHNNYALGFEIKHADPTGGDGFGVLGAGNLGASVSSAGDFNKDGVEDIAIGAPTFSPSQELLRGGAAYIIFGRNSSSENVALQGNFDSNILLDQANWSNGGQYGFQITSSQADARLGIVSGLGDVNGDDVVDVGLGAARGGSDGAVFALYGMDKNSGFADISVGEPTFPRTRDGVEVDADGNPVVVETPETTAAATPAAFAVDGFFDGA